MTVPRITVVIATWNRKHWLEQAIDSVLRQEDSPPFEIVIVNDGSTDGTDTFVAGLGHPAKGLTISHTGNQARVKNSGLEVARGEYVLFLDDDDLLESNALRDLGRALDGGPSLGFAFGDVRYFEAGGDIGPKYLERRYDDDRDALWNLIAGVPLFGLATLVRRKLLLTLGGFDTSKTSAEDYDLWLRVASSSKGVRLADVVARIRRHSSSLSTTMVAEGCEGAAASLSDLLRQGQLPRDYEKEARRTRWRLYRQIAALHLRATKRDDALKFAKLALGARPASLRSWVTFARARLSREHSDRFR
jgi:GT2 family glycosyltransferase